MLVLSLTCDKRCRQQSPQLRTDIRQMLAAGSPVRNVLPVASPLPRPRTSSCPINSFNFRVGRRVYAFGVLPPPIIITGSSWRRVEMRKNSAETATPQKATASDERTINDDYVYDCSRQSVVSHDLRLSNSFDDLLGPVFSYFQDVEHRRYPVADSVRRRATRTAVPS